MVTREPSSCALGARFARSSANPVTPACDTTSGECALDQPGCSPGQAAPPSYHRDDRSENPEDCEPAALWSLRSSVGWVRTENLFKKRARLIGKTTFTHGNTLCLDYAKLSISMQHACRKTVTMAIHGSPLVLWLRVQRKAASTGSIWRSCHLRKQSKNSQKIRTAAGDRQAAATCEK